MHKLRKIKVSDKAFLWKRGHYHLKDFSISECAEKVVIYIEGYKNSPLNLHFIEDDNLWLFPKPDNRKWCVGYLDSGVIWIYQPNKEQKPQSKNISINLNRPAVIAKLIEYFYNSPWKPEKQRTPTIIKDAIKYLEVIDLPEGI